MMPSPAPALRLVLPRLLLKAAHHHAGMYKHTGGYYLLNGRWHSVKADKPAPKGAPVAAHKHAAGQFQPVKHFTPEQWQQLQLPAENVNAGSFNKQLAQLQAMSDAGDVTGILGMSVGTNTYGKKLATIANHLLGLHGTEHKVAPGQKAGTHAAVQAAPEPAAAAVPGPAPEAIQEPALVPAPEPAASPEPAAEIVPVAASMPAPPEFSEGKTTAGVKAYYEKVAAKVLAAAGDAVALEQIKADGLKPNAKGKVTNTWAGKTANSKVLLDWHAQLVAAAGGAQAAPAVPAASETVKPVRLVVQKPDEAPAAAPVAAPVPAAASAGSKLDQIPWDKQLLPPENKNAKSHNKQVEKIKAMAYAGDEAGLEAFKAGTNTYGKKQNLLAQTALAGLKEGGAPQEAAVPTPAPAAQPEPASAPAPAAPISTPEPADAPAAPADDGIVKLDGYPQKFKEDPSAESGWVFQHSDSPEWYEVMNGGTVAALNAEVGKVEQGPQDGDTKPGADGGTLVFKDGRWHKVVPADEHGEVPPALVPVEDAAPTYNKISPKQAISLGVALKTAAGNKAKLKAWAVAGDGAAIEGFIAGNGQHQPASKKYAQKLLEAMAAAPAGQPAAAALATPGKAPPAAAGPSAVESAALEAIDGWAQTGPQGGSNPGGRFKDAEGVEWYCKFPADESIAKSEVLAARLYGAAGVAGQDAKLITKNGKVGIASRWVTVKKAGSPADLAKTQGAQSGFAVDAWLANWDVVGLGYDNLQVGADGKAVRVDAGGSLQYRAQGSKKPFGPKADEIDTLRDAAINPQAASVFGKMTHADITASVAKVAGIEDSQIRALVEEFGPGSKVERDALADTLIARKADLLARFPKAAKAPKKRIDPTKLPVSAAQLPKPHDFANWHGQGSGLSSKAHVNAANTAVEVEAHGVAMQGNLVALKEFKYHGIDKDTGNAVGAPIPIAKHPSKHVVQYHADLVQALDEIANPPEPLKIFKATETGTLASLSAAFPPKPFGTTVASVKSNEKLGFWVALGAAANVAKFVPKKVSNYTGAAVAAAVQKYKDAKPLAKHFISSVQASGSYNDLFRDGKTHDKAGNSLADVAQAALEHATEMPEGTSIYRWQTMTDQMLKHIMSAPDGTVFQATGPMCTSYSPEATKGFGKHRIVIRYAKGAKAVESFASGAFKGEKEVTTLPNNRFIILSKKMVPDTEHGNPAGQRAEIEVLMLPPDLGIPGVKG